MSAITSDMSIYEVLEIDRTTAKIFMEFGMHCLGCPHAMGESIADASEAHGVDVEDMLRQLNDHISAKAL
ncbi:MAG: DUF1858 domain-containing protein [Oscillospiraceae bacterium]|jgi:hybrid cluster-associated redox disulfide protein|nr:DUF1858 domain-containing protein [Oscillospiraceae bacterium]